MLPAPPKWLERLVAFLLPPACREEVLGDLHERFTSPVRYAIEAFATLPLVILSRIRRTVDPEILLLETFCLVLGFVCAAWYHDRTLLQEEWGIFRLSIPAIMALLALVLEQAYAVPGNRSPWKPLRAPVSAFLTALVSQAVLSSQTPDIALPRWIFTVGSAIALLLVTAVRLLFPPVTDRPLGAGGPADWLKQAGAPLYLSPATTRVLKIAVALIAAALFGALLGRRT